MKNPTFEQQFTKIVNAYLKNSLSAYKSCACFVGNLLNNKDEWGAGRYFSFDLDGCPSIESINIPEKALKCLKDESNGFYSMKDVCKLETSFLNTLNLEEIITSYEERLFKAMEITLQLLREIHESKGEIVKDYNFAKRELSHV